MGEVLDGGPASPASMHLEQSPHETANTFQEQTTNVKPNRDENRGARGRGASQDSADHDSRGHNRTSERRTTPIPSAKETKQPIPSTILRILLEQKLERE
eukprot:956089-Prymnesium_polylepis.1